MVLDVNPAFGKDRQLENHALSVSRMLWETSRGDMSSVPSSYLDALDFEYSDGSRCLLSQLGKVDFNENSSYDEFSEVVEHLIRVDPNEWADTDSILSIQKDKLLYEIEPEITEFGEFDFADGRDLSSKVELFLKKVISSVYLDGVTSVTDSQGNPPNVANNYLMSPDGTKFSGIFYDKGEGANKQFPFEIRENKKGNFEIVY